MSDLFEIRAMAEGDAEAVAELSARLGYPRTAEDVVRWLHSVQISQGTVRSLCGFVAVIHGSVAGWIEVGIDRWVQEEPYAHIGGLVVREGVRGKRVGQRLCETTEQWAREQGVVWMRVLSRATRVDAHRFYLRDGYERVKTSEVFAKRLL